MVGVICIIICNAWMHIKWAKKSLLSSVSQHSTPTHSHEDDGNHNHQYQKISSYLVNYDCRSKKHPLQTTSSAKPASYYYGLMSTI